MSADGAVPFPKWIADAMAVLLALAALALITYFVGAKAHIWQSPSGGFWVL